MQLHHANQQRTRKSLRGERNFQKCWSSRRPSHILAQANFEIWIDGGAVNLFEESCTLNRRNMKSEFQMERWLDVGKFQQSDPTFEFIWQELVCSSDKDAPLVWTFHRWKHFSVWHTKYACCNLLYLRPEIPKIWDYVESGYASICSSIEKLLVFGFLFVCLNFADHATLACFYPCLVNQEKEAMLAVWLLRPISLDTAGCLHLWMPGMRMRIFCRILLFPTRSCVGLFDSHQKIYY